MPAGVSLFDFIVYQPPTNLDIGDIVFSNIRDHETGVQPIRPNYCGVVIEVTSGDPDFNYVTFSVFGAAIQKINTPTEITFSVIRRN